jgi:electron transfer flavoprotein alpha subunit
MAGIYIYSDRKDIVAELVGYAKLIGKEANVITVCAEKANEVQGIGADKVYVLKGNSTITESYGKAIAEFLKEKNAEILLVGATARGRDLAARVAGYLDCGMVSDVSSLSYQDGKVKTERMFYGGAIVQTEVLSGLCVITVPEGLFEALSDVNSRSEVLEVSVASDDRVVVKSTAAIVKQGTNIASAEKIICVGMGLNKEEDVNLARELAGVLGAEVACSRGIAEERQWLPVENYIGISGTVVKPQLYLSLGVSGQVQHVYGMRDSKVIVAINSDEKAPIFKAADYGIVGDLYEVIPLLTQALKAFQQA